MNLYANFRIKYIALYNKLQHVFKDSFNAEKFERNQADYLVISRPACGRTWLRVMIGLALKQVSDVKFDSVNPQSLFYLHQLNPKLPCIKASHESFLGSSSYLDKHVILLVRDPRGSLLSNTTKVLRLDDNKWKGKDFSYILRHGDYLRDMIHLYNNWADHQETPKSFMLLRYEDLVENTEQELKRVFTFLGLDVSDELIEFAIKNSSFKQMHKFDNRSFKFRSGKATDFKTLLSRDDLDWIENQISQSLNPIYGYNYFTDYDGSAAP